MNPIAPVLGSNLFADDVNARAHKQYRNVQVYKNNPDISRSCVHGVSFINLTGSSHICDLHTILLVA
jgi:hypothetical protein